MKFPCSVCANDFTRRESLKDHLVVRHGLMLRSGSTTETYKPSDDELRDRRSKIQDRRGRQPVSTMETRRPRSRSRSAGRSAVSTDERRSDGRPPALGQPLKPPSGSDKPASVDRVTSSIAMAPAGRPQSPSPRKRSHNNGREERAELRDAMKIKQPEYCSPGRSSSASADGTNEAASATEFGRQPNVVDDGNEMATAEPSGFGPMRVLTQTVELFELFGSLSPSPTSSPVPAASHSGDVTTGPPAPSDNSAGSSGGHSSVSDIVPATVRAPLSSTAYVVDVIVDWLHSDDGMRWFSSKFNEGPCRSCPLETEACSTCARRMIVNKLRRN